MHRGRPATRARRMGRAAGGRRWSTSARRRRSRRSACARRGSTTSTRGADPDHAEEGSSAMDALEWLTGGDPAIRWQVAARPDAEPADVVAARARAGRDRGLGRGTAGAPDAGRRVGRRYGAVAVDLEHRATCHVALAWLRDWGSTPRCRAGAARGRTRPRAAPGVAGSMDRTRSSTARSSRASTAASSRPARTSAWTCSALVERLLGEQLADGGWNCEVENGATRRRSTRRSTSSKACSSTSGRPAGRPRSPRRAGAARSTCSSARLFRRMSTGEVDRPGVQPVLVPDLVPLRRPARARLPARRRRPCPTSAWREAIGVVESKRESDGRWPLEHPHDDQLDVGTGELEGEPSRWITLRAMRVLRWYEGR